MIRYYLICAMICTFLSHTTAREKLQYRNSELNRLSQTLHLHPDSLSEGMNYLVINGRQIKAQIDNGVLIFLGYCLFSNELKSMAHTPIFNFLERYFLQLDHPEKDRPLNKVLKEDRFVFNKGSVASVAQIKQDDSFSFGDENKRYWATWTRDGQEFLSVSFPANHELISGENKVESEINVEADILAAHVDSVIPVNESVLITTHQKGYYIKKGSTYLNGRLISDLYYQRYQGHDSPKLIADESHPLESASNLMLSLELQNDCSLKIKQILYGYKKKTFEVPLRNWLAYCKNSGCQLYWGVESFDNNIIKATIVAVNEAENYNHILFVNIPVSVIISGSGSIEARLDSFIPMHNVTNIFGKYRNLPKQPKIFEE